MSSITVIEAETALASAKAEAERQRREDARRLVRQLRDEEEALRAELGPVKKEFNDMQNARLRRFPLLLGVRNRIVYLENLLDKKTGSRKQTAEWVSELEGLRLKQKGLRAEADDDREREERAAARLPKMELALRDVGYKILTWEAVSEGRLPGEITGGVYQGVEDFIGSMPITNL
jgi:hypothetical protein